MNIRRPIHDFMRAAIKSGLQKIPETLAKTGLVFGIRALALSASSLTVAFCGTSDICHLAANHSGDLLIDAAATGIALVAITPLWNGIKHRTAPVLTAAALVLSAYHLASTPPQAGQQAVAAYNVMDHRAKLV